MRKVCLPQRPQKHTNKLSSLNYYTLFSFFVRNARATNYVGGRRSMYINSIDARAFEPASGILFRLCAESAPRNLRGTCTRPPLIIRTRSLSRTHTGAINLILACCWSREREGGEQERDEECHFVKGRGERRRRSSHLSVSRLQKCKT